MGSAPVRPWVPLMALATVSPVAVSTDSFDKRGDLCARSQMMNALRRRALLDQPSVFGSQPTVTAPDHPVAVHGAAPDRAVFRPAVGRSEEPQDQPFRD